MIFPQVTRFMLHQNSHLIGLVPSSERVTNNDRFSLLGEGKATEHAQEQEHQDIV